MYMVYVNKKRVATLSDRKSAQLIFDQYKLDGYTWILMNQVMSSNGNTFEISRDMTLDVKTSD